eukprot:gene8769-7114_t
MVDVARGLAPGDWAKHYLSDLCYIPSDNQLILAGRNTYFFRAATSSDPLKAADVPVVAVEYCHLSCTFITAAGGALRSWDARDGRPVALFHVAPEGSSVT